MSLERREGNRLSGGLTLFKRRARRLMKPEAERIANVHKEYWKLMSVMSETYTELYAL